MFSIDVRIKLTGILELTNMKEDFWLEYIEKNPMLVDEVTDWKISVVCSECGGALPQEKNLFSHRSLDRYFNPTYMEFLSRYGHCPICMVERPYSHKGGMCHIKPLPSHRIRSRIYYLESQKKTWYGKKLPRKHFIQKEKL